MTPEDGSVFQARPSDLLKTVRVSDMATDDQPPSGDENAPRESRDEVYKALGIRPVANVHRTKSLGRFQPRLVGSLRKCEEEVCSFRSAIVSCRARAR
jgi:hypothetical protein